MRHTHYRFPIRILALCLCALLLAVGTATFLPLSSVAEDGILSDDPVTINGYTGGGMSPRQITADYGIRLSLGAPFDAWTVTMVTWTQKDAKATLSLYKWTVDYSTTIQQEPLASLRLDPVQDNSGPTLSFDEMPAGEYLFRISDISGTVGIYHKDMSVSQGYCYDSGKETRADWWMSIHFTKTPAEPFHEVSSILDGIDGKHTAPEEWTPAEDSLLNTHKVMPSTWVFTDGLGRVSLTNAEVGDPKEDKTVAMFYWTWHADSSDGEPLNLQEFISEHPEAANDYDNSAWPEGSVSYFWDEPLWGYYRTDDEWVLRRQAELLANAGVDTIFTDNTNGGFT